MSKNGRSQNRPRPGNSGSRAGGTGAHASGRNGRSMPANPGRPTARGSYTAAPGQGGRKPSNSRSRGNPATKRQREQARKQHYAPTVWHRDHRVALVLIIMATVITVGVAFLGPSAVTLTLGPRDSWLPPWYVPVKAAKSADWAVSASIWVAILTAGLGLFTGSRALADGWRPHLRRLFALGVVLSTATCLVPPLTSADVLMYAAYGRLQTIGRSPYDITPAEVFRSQYDPVLTLTERPWNDTPSVYGPITSWIQWLANYLGGENMHDIVFWLQMFALVPFILTCAGVFMLAHGDRNRQARAVLFGICNPLLIWAVLAGAHSEALSVMFAVFGLMMMRKSPVLAGLGIGLAGCAKLSIGIYGLAMLWAYRREPKKAALLLLGTFVPMALCYIVWQPSAFIQVLRNGGYVSVGSWANPIFRFFDLFATGVHAKIIVGVVSYTMLIVITWMLSRVVPWTAAPGLLPGQDPRRDPITIALRTALVLSVAWLVTSVYTLSWYDLIAWVPLAVWAMSRLDRLFILRGTFLSLAYVPGRSIDVTPSLDLVATRVRDTVSPIVQMFVLAAIVHWWWSDRKRRQPKRATAEAADNVPVAA